MAALKLPVSSLLVTADAKAVRCDLVFGGYLVWRAMVGGLSSFVQAAVLLVIVLDRFRRAPLC